MESKGQGQQLQEEQRQMSSHGGGPSQPSSSMPAADNFMNKEHSAYDLGELDQALILYLDGQSQAGHSEQRQTLNIFPSLPMHEENPSTKGSVTLVSSSEQKPMDRRSNVLVMKDSKAPLEKRESVNRKWTGASSSEQEGPKTPDPRRLRRLAQNREAARKSRLRKKAYVQQLESSRMRLAQLEQELQKARTQGMFFGGGGGLCDQGFAAGGISGSLTAEAAMFDMEYTRWLEEHHRLMSELRAAVQEQMPENGLRMYVDSFLAHYNEMINLKNIVAKADAFHLVSGVWKTPAERCFMWMGGFRPSDLIKIAVRHVEPLSDHQILGVCGLQQSTQETEDALTQGLEALNQSLSDTITSDALEYPSSSSNVANYMGQMAMAINKLSTLEAFVHQADNLRQQTLHRLHQILSVHQAARGFLAISEYFHRLRALSSLWLARPRQDL